MFLSHGDSWQDAKRTANTHGNTNAKAVFFICLFIGLNVFFVIIMKNSIYLFFRIGIENTDNTV